MRAVDAHDLLPVHAVLLARHELALVVAVREVHGIVVPRVHGLEVVLEPLGPPAGVDLDVAADVVLELQDSRVSA